MTNALTTLKRSALPDSDLPVPAFPALSINPEKCKFDSGVAWKLRGLQISKPQIQSVAAYCVRLFGARAVFFDYASGGADDGSSKSRGDLHRVKYIALERRLDSIEADAVVTTAYETDIFGMRPAERHRCPGRSSAFHSAVRQIRGVPKLFRNHAASISEPFNRFDKQHRIALSSEFIRAALARQYGPRTSDPRSHQKGCHRLFVHSDRDYSGASTDLGEDRA